MFSFYFVGRKKNILYNSSCMAVSHSDVHDVIVPKNLSSCDMVIMSALFAQTIITQIFYSKYNFSIFTCLQFETQRCFVIKIKPQTLKHITTFPLLIANNNICRARWNIYVVYNRLNFKLFFCKNQFIVFTFEQGDNIITALFSKCGLFKNSMYCLNALKFSMTRSV